MNGNNAMLLKARVATYWRYDRQCPMLAIEASSRLIGWNSGGQSDVLVLNKQGQLIEIEVKLSISDMRGDREKPKHYHFYKEYFDDEAFLPDVKGWRYYRDRWGIRKRYVTEEPGYPISMFYFAVPECLRRSAIEVIAELYPYAGLLVVEDPANGYGINFYNYNPISLDRQPHLFQKAKLSDSELLHMQREMSATICRLTQLLSDTEGDTIASEIEHVVGMRG